MYNDAQKQEIYKIYISDNLRIISENTAKLVNGSYIKKRYAEIIEPKKQVEDKRQANEIVDDIVKKAGIKVVKNK